MRRTVGLLLIAGCRLRFDDVPVDAADGAMLPCTLTHMRSEIPAPNGPRAFVVMDFDGDGNEDLAVTEGANGANRVGVALGRGDGTFGARQTYATGMSPWSIAAGDLNGDDRPDLAVGAYDSDQVNVYRNLGDGTFQPDGIYATAGAPQSVVIADTDGDGARDVIVAEHDAATVSVLRNDLGDGKLLPRVPQGVQPMPYAVVAGDMTGDGRPDLVVAQTSGTVSVLVNQGGGAFAPQVSYSGGVASPLTPQPWSLAVVDLDRDGDLDVIVADNFGNDAVNVLLGAGDGTLGAPTQYLLGASMLGAAWWVDSADLDRDDIPDVVVAGGYENSIYVLLGTGDGTLRMPPLKWTGATEPVCLGVADIDHDGHVDVLTSDQASNVVSIFQTGCQ